MNEEFAKSYAIKTEKRRFNQYDVERYMRGALRLAAEDIRALIPAPAREGE